MKRIFLPALAIALMGYACNNSSNQQKENDTTSADTAVVNTANAAEEAEQKKSVKDIFADFPTMATTAQTGEYVLIPSYKMLEKHVNGDKGAMIYYQAKMAKPGETISGLAFTFDGEQEVPNHMIVPIASGQKVQKGDIVLTWWQSGSGMQRAIVTNAQDPTAPEVHYLDISWDNPAQKDGLSIGQMKEKIKENTFAKLTNEWQPGTSIAYLDGTNMKKFTIINVSGDKVLALGFAGTMKILEKSACTALKVNNQVKVGDKVQAPWVGTFKSGVVTEVKSEYGRAVVKFDHLSDEEEVIPFGDITTGLIL